MAKMRFPKRGHILLLAAGLIVAGVWAFSGSRPQLDTSNSPGRKKETVAHKSGDVTPAEVGEPVDDLPPPLKSADEDEPAPQEISVETSGALISGFPETVTIGAGDEQFTTTYTGMFTRSKNVLFVPIALYSIASYVENPHEVNSKALLDRLLKDGPRKVYILRFLKPLPGNQILNAIREEINATFSDVDMDRLESNINQFVQIFSPGSSTGDEVYMVWLPGGKLYCSFKDQSKLEMIAQDVPLARAIWRIWAGEQTGEERLSLVERFTERK